MNNYKVYIHKFPNGKVYVGITMQDVEKRWENGSGYRGQSYVFNAIMKYGWQNIEHIVLFDGLSKEEAEEKEIALIRLYDSTNRDKGYNVANGGSSVGKHSDYVREKISEGVKFAYTRTDYRKKRIDALKTAFSSEEYLEMRSELTKNQWKREDYRKLMSSVHKGKVVSEETKNKISEAKTGKHMGAENHNSRAVIQYTKDGVFVAIFDSAKTAQRETGENNAKICDCCKGRRQTCGGFRWKYAD